MHPHDSLTLASLFISWTSAIDDPYPLGGCETPDAFVILVPEGNMSTWSDLSNEVSTTVQGVGKSVITLQAEGNRTVSGIVLDERTIVTTASVIGVGTAI